MMEERRRTRRRDRKTSRRWDRRQGRSSRTCGCGGNRNRLKLPDPKNDNAQVEQLVTDAAALDKLVQSSSPAQRDLLKQLAQKSGARIIAAGVGGDDLAATQGLTPDDIAYLMTLEWNPAKTNDAKLFETIRQALAARHAQAAQAAKKAAEQKKKTERRSPRVRTLQRQRIRSRRQMRRRSRRSLPIKPRSNWPHQRNPAMGSRSRRQATNPKALIRPLNRAAIPPNAKAAQRPDLFHPRQ